MMEDIESKDKKVSQTINWLDLAKKLEKFVQDCHFKFDPKKYEELIKDFDHDSDEYLFLSSLAEVLYFTEEVVEGYTYHRQGLIDKGIWQNKILRLLANKDNREIAQVFWRYFQEIYELYNRALSQKLGVQKQQKIIQEMTGIKQGSIGEIGFYKTLKKLGFNPRISTEKENIDAGTDMIIERPGLEILIQVKHTKQIAELRVYDVHNPRELERLNKEEASERNYKQIYGKIREAIEKVCGVCWDKKIKNSNTDFSGLVVVIPVGFFDEIAGEPKKEAIQKIQEMVGPHLQKEGAKVIF